MTEVLPNFKTGEKKSILNFENCRQMGRKSRIFSGAEKAKIVLEVLRERQTLTEIAQKFEVHPVQVSSWKKEAQEHLSDLFSDKRSRDKEHED